MKQRSFAEPGYARRPKQTKRQQFLAEMDAVRVLPRFHGRFEKV